jgi:hypothetical protein
MLLVVIQKRVIGDERIADEFLDDRVASVADIDNDAVIDNRAVVDAYRIHLERNRIRALQLK